MVRAAVADATSGALAGFGLAVWAAALALGVGMLVVQFFLLVDLLPMTFRQAIPFEEIQHCSVGAEPRDIVVSGAR